MTASYQHLQRRAGAHLMGRQQQRCMVATRPVVISVWNKNTGAGCQK